jgi:hypothetical protein
MLNIYKNIIIGTPHDLSLVMNNVHYIINCSVNLNNLIIHPNFININLTMIDNNALNLLFDLYCFVKNKIFINNTIFILCETGINTSLFVGMYLIMKLCNLPFNDVYNIIVNAIKIHPYNTYSILKYYENFIFQQTNNNMDLS